MMHYNKLGKTGLQLSTVGFGASSLGGVFHDFDEGRGIDAVLQAVESGMNYIDVSPYYGYTKAETVLGKALRQLPRESFIISTKVGRYGLNGKNHWDYSAQRAQESVGESMERLGIDRIDLIFVHDIEFANLQQVAEETLPALHELKQKGLVDHVGCTDLQIANLKWMVEHTPKGTVEAVLNFCHYCLCDDALADAFDFFHSHDVGLINASPFSMGLLTERGTPAWHPAPEPLKAACRRATDYCREQGYPIEKLAMQFSCQCDDIASTVFSTTNPDNLRRNLAWAAEPIDQQLLAQVQAIIGDAKGLTWKNT